MIEAVHTRGLEAGFLELLDDVGLGFAEAFAAGFAPFEIVVGEKLHVRPPGVAVEVFRGRLRESDCGCGGEEE